jgi:hypothetical protein
MMTITYFERNSSTQPLLECGGAFGRRDAE